MIPSTTESKTNHQTNPKRNTVAVTATPRRPMRAKYTDRKHIFMFYPVSILILTKHTHNCFNQAFCWDLEKWNKEKCKWKIHYFLCQNKVWLENFNQRHGLDNIRLREDQPDKMIWSCRFLNNQKKKKKGISHIHTQIIDLKSTIFCVLEIRYFFFFSS